MECCSTIIQLLSVQMMDSKSTYLRDVGTPTAILSMRMSSNSAYLRDVCTLIPTAALSAIA